MDILNLLITVVIPAALGFAGAWGTMATRVDYLTKEVEELKSELRDFRKLTEDMAVVKNDINSIKTMIARILKDVE